MEPTKALVESDPFSEMERADEQMVLDEIKGRALDALVYEFRQGGQTVTGLSLAGVRETARSMNKNGQARIGISEREPVITETDAYFEVKVYAHDSMNGGGYWGIKRQAKQYERSVNQFALEQALAKAQRNALRGLIPEWFVKEMIEAWRQKGHVRTVGTRPPTTASVKQVEPKPVPPTPEQIEQLRVDAHDSERPWVTEPRPEPTVPGPATAHLPPAPVIPSKSNETARQQLQAMVDNWERNIVRPQSDDQIKKARQLTVMRLSATARDGSDNMRHAVIRDLFKGEHITTGSITELLPHELYGLRDWLQGDAAKEEIAKIAAGLRQAQPA